MSEQRYILTIQNNNIFKEVDVSPATPVIKIGTLQECDVRLKGELFDSPVCVTLRLNAGEWYVLCSDGLCINSDSVKNCMEAVIHHGDVLSVCADNGRTVVLSMYFSYDFTVYAVDFNTIIDIRDKNNFLIGNAPNAQIKLGSRFVGSEYLSFTRGKGGVITLDAIHAPKSATVNGIRLFDTVELREYDFIGIADYSFYFKNQVLYTLMRDDMCINGIPSEPLRDETPAFEYPKLNRSPRMLYALDDDPIEILNPPKKPEKPRESLILQLSPALLMMAVTVVTRSGMIGGLSSGNNSFLIYSLSAMAVGIVTSVAGFISGKNRYKKDLAEWNADYTAYIENKRREIEAAQTRELSALIDIYPSVGRIRDFVKTFSGRLFERSPKDADFLHVRVGLGAVPALRDITCHQQENIKLENELALIPQQICGEYKFINNSPVMLHLRESGTVGVVGEPAAQYEFFKSLLLDVCVQHSYEDVQAVVLIPPDEQKKYEWIKWLPHIKESGDHARGIVCDDESRDNIFEYLYAALTERAAKNPESGNVILLPHIVVFALEEYGIKTHPLSKYAEDCADLGISFVFFKEYMENLPRHCAEIVELDKNGGTLRLRNDKAFLRPFVREQVKDESIKFAAERLAPVYCEKISLSSRLTSHITLFELLNIISPDNLNLLDRWAAANVQKSLAAPIGVDVKGGVVSLDVHERAHGAHGLVAGTTGSGKSEIMQSYILSAAVNFHPYEVSFVIIDFKGGGMANQFERLPHLIGKITDIDSHEINRSLLSIRAELEKRKRLFAEHDVNHIDHYIAKFRSGEATDALPHLILIVDEFAELKAKQPEFMTELISTARVGRSLGIHLILATQKPAGQVNEQIWSNSRFKLCLKVATKEDSNEVLKSPLAAEILEPGRAYLQVGNNEIFTLLQSAYSGASASSDKNGNTREFSISEVSFTGKRTVVYKSKVEHSSDGSKITQLRSMIDYIDNYCKQAGILRLPQICMPPLPDTVAYEPGVPVKGIGTELCVGIYDNPSRQEQPCVYLNLSAGNVIIVGSSQTGKTMLLQTILRGIAERCSTKQTSVYILDFASKSMKVFERLNHVGGVLTDSDDEMLKSFFKMIGEEMIARKEEFSRYGISSYEAYMGLNEPDKRDLPHIIIMVDNLTVFKEAFQDYEDAMLNLCREGLALGITVIATAKQTSGLSYRYFSNFSSRIAFNCTESSEYSSIFDRCQIRPRNIQGRGLVAIDKVVYEFQAYLPFAGDTESRRIEQAKEFIAGTAKRLGAVRARAIPSIPPLLTGDYWRENALEFDKYTIPAGLTYSEIEPVVIDLARVGTVGIYGREGFGKSNLVRVIMNHLHRHVFDVPCEAYLIDSYSRQLSEFENYGFVQQYTVDCANFEDIVQIFGDAVKTRMDILYAGGTLDDEPLLLCVIQNPQIFAANVVSKTVSDRFKKLTAEAKQLKMCFIFSDIENNPEYSPPDMMKYARDLSLYFLLDDMANVKLFSSSKFTQHDLKPYKKPISLGDGYIYNSSSGIEKIKLVLCERGT